MQTEIRLLITKDCFILCHIFRCTIEDILLFYIRHVSVSAFLQEEEDEETELATYFFIKYGCGS